MPANVNNRYAIRQSVLRRSQVPASMNAMNPNSAPHEWNGSLESRSSSPAPVIEE